MLASQDIISLPCRLRECLDEDTSDVAKEEMIIALLSRLSRYLIPPLRVSLYRPNYLLTLK